MILSAPKFCIAEENCLRWQVFQKRFSKLIVTPIFHNNRDLSTVATQITKDNLDKDCFLILEDDACAVNSDYIESLQEIEKQLLEINIHWDILYLGAHLLGGCGEVLTKNIFQKTVPYCTQAVLYRSSSYETLLGLKSKNLNVNPHCWDLMICDSNLVKLVVNPMIITQLDCCLPFDENVNVHRIMENSYEVVRNRLRL